MKPANKKGSINVRRVGDKDEEEVENPTEKALKAAQPRPLKKENPVRSECVGSVAKEAT